MSESVKPRFAVDLNEIERHLAQAGSHPSQPAAATRNDPLAELARIVGQEDPFQAILANDGAARPRQQPSPIDELFAARDNVTPAARQARPQAQAEAFEVSAFDRAGYARTEAPRGRASAYGYQQAAPVQPQDSHDQGAYADEYYDQADGYGQVDGYGQADGYGQDDYAQPDRLDYPAVRKPRSRKGLVAVGAVLGAIAVVGAGAYLFMGSSGPVGGEPILVQATKAPVKVQPQNPGGVEIPNQNKQIYERTQTTDTKVVNREEQPVDVKQAMHSNGSAMADATGATAASAASQSRGTPNSLNLGEPRKVRTVTIRPDGSMVGAPEAPGARPASAAAPAMTMPATAQPKPVSPSATPVAAPATPSSAPKPTPAAATPVNPVPAAAPAPQRVASAQPIPVAAPAATDTTTTAAGGYAVQLGLANSESAAETAFASYQRKYSDLEGLPSMIRKAEVNGNTIFRVRVGPMSREEASSLCSKLQGQGGQCFVAKN
ncbi:SPOR domain-containing protein [Microvirga sp. TS319]|uniref:SPOR domain-containing protein n=1 Tax=Microvirga sp. TS319 TaxID=3241165 RepID=UPI00351A2283